MSALRVNGVVLRDVFCRWQGNAAFDDTFTANVVAAARGAASAELGHRPVARLILDTGVLIARVRGRVHSAALANTDDVAVPAHTHRAGNRRAYTSSESLRPPASSAAR